MARLFNDASSEYGAIASTPVTEANVFMVSCWAYNDDVTQAGVMFSLCNSASAADRYVLRCKGDVAGDYVHWGVQGSGGFNEAISSTGMTVNTWHHCAGWEASSSLRGVMIDGGSYASDTTTDAASGINRMGIGLFYDLTPGTYWSGRLADVCVWNMLNWGASASERDATAQVVAAQLAKGASPLEFTLGLVAYWPLWGNESPEPDLHPRSRTNADYEATMVGTTKANGPPIMPYSHRMWYPAEPVIEVASSGSVGRALTHSNKLARTSLVG